MDITRTFFDEEAHQMFNNDGILHHIFSYLSVDDLKSCRLVSKKWNVVSEQKFRHDSVIFFGFGDKNESLDDLMERFQEFQDFSHSFSPTAYHFCAQTPFPWENPLMVNFFKRNGPSMKFLHFGMGNPRECKSQPKSAMADFITLFNVLFEYASGFEVITLYWEIYGRVGVCSIDRTLDYPEIIFRGELKHLKSLSLETDVSRCEHSTSVKLRTLLSESLSQLLAKTVNLEKILITNTFLLNSVAKLKTFVSTVKELSVQVWNDSEDLTMDAVQLLGDKGLRLTSFSILYKEKSQRFYSMLMHFLNTQKKCLKKLYLCHQNFEGNSVEVLPQFPKMEKLTKLEISCSSSLVFANPDWICQFPAVRQLEYTFTNREDPLGNCFQSFLCGGEHFNENVRFIRVNSNSPLNEYLEKRNVSLDDCIRLYEISKTKFPNLVNLLLSNIDNTGTNQTFLYNGRIEDAIATVSVQ